VLQILETYDIILTALTTYTPFFCNLLNSLWSHLQHITTCSYMR